MPIHDCSGACAQSRLRRPRPCLSEQYSGVFRGLAGLALALALPAGAFGQAVTGTILGTVRDPSGAAAVGAQVSVVSGATGFTRSTQTNDTGEYSFPNLPTGVYSVTAEAKGFKRAVFSGIALSVDQKARLDVTLQVGDVTESIQVESVAPLVQTDSSELGAVVNEKQIKDLPLNGRNFVQLTRLIPGVLRGIPGANIDGAGSLAWRASASFVANGMRTRDNNFMLDGVDNNETWLNSAVVFPNVDALQEFKVQTATYSAEFGRSNGGIVNIQIKSGTNEFHGSAYEFVRNNIFDANDWFNNRARRARPPFRQNQFGGTFGGRIVRDKTFFFMNYQGWRRREAQNFLSNVPTLAMRQGDFSELTRVIYDPLSRTPFPNNRIPSARFDPAANNIMQQLYPEPNTPGSRAANGQTINNFLFNPSLKRDDDQFDVKVDHRFHSKNNAFARYSFQRTPRFLPASLPRGDAGFVFGAGNGLVRAQSLAINDTHTFTPTLLNEFRFGFSRFGIKVTSIDAGTNLAERMGIPGINISDIATAMSQITFSPGDIRNLGANGNQPLFTFLDTFQYFDNLTWIRGNHTVKGGFNYTARRRNILNVDNPLGNFNFQNSITSNCGGATTACTIDPNSGFTVATFLLGFPTSINRQLINGIYGERRPEYSWYIQDDIRLFKRLTLNIGLRHEVFVPFLEVYDRYSNFDTGTGRFVLAGPSAPYSDGRDFGRRLRRTPLDNFGPRVGFAWDLFGTGRTVVRSGYGMFFNSPMTGSSSSMALNPPYLLSQSLTTTLQPTLRLRDGLPPPPTVNPNLPPQGGTRSIFDPDFLDGRAQQWNLNIQQGLWRDFLFEVGYVGTRGTRLVMKRQINRSPNLVGVTNFDANRPYIRISPLLRDLERVESRGSSIYHSLQLKAQKRFSSGLQFLSAYTWGKVIDIASDTESATLDPYNFNYDRGLAAFDVGHTLSQSWTYELPFGKGKRFLGSVSSAANLLIGGWEIGGILLARSGLPFTVVQQQNLLSTGSGNRPDRIGNGKLSNRSVDRWFDIGAFRPTADNTGTFGSSGRNILRGPRQHQWDLSLVKNTVIRERYRLQIRWEAFNAFNRPQFANPGTSIGTANAGVITSLLFNTPMRQMQMAAKLNF